MTAQTKGVEVIAARAQQILSEPYSDRNNLAIRIARMEQREAAIAELIGATKRTVRAFEALGKTRDIARQLEAHRECEAALIAQKEALARCGIQP